ncbi:MAG: tetratricopeptide repeat protein [Alphaproteobacteria bacterium]|nr:tetratricopeptide repeat protein [Alphaproteobacteria bacterium]
MVFSNWRKLSFSHAGLLTLPVLCLFGAPLFAQESGGASSVDDILQAIEREAEDTSAPAQPRLPGEMDERTVEDAHASAEPPESLPQAETVPGAEDPMMESVPEIIPNEVVEVPVPSADSLYGPGETTQIPGVAPSPAASIPSLPEDEEADVENLFFDAEALVPSGEMGRKGGPKKVNPRLEPASKFIVVRKDAGKDSKSARLVAADRAIKLGRYEAALEIYEGLYAKNRRDPNVLMGRAVALHNLGRTEEAIRAYEELLDIRPKNVEARINMLGVLGQKYPAVALQRLLKLYEDNPDNVGIVAQIAVVQAQMARYNEAIRYLGVAASMEPNNASHVYNMAVIADRAGNKKEAIRFYENALEVDTLSGAGQSIPRDVIFARLAQLR